MARFIIKIANGQQVYTYAKCRVLDELASIMRCNTVEAREFYDKFIAPLKPGEAYDGAMFSVYRGDDGMTERREPKPEDAKGAGNV